MKVKSESEVTQLCPTLPDPMVAAHQAPLSLGLSKQEQWSGLPFLSPMHESESEVAQLCLTRSDPMDCSLPGSSVHGIFQAKSTGVGCHRLLHDQPRQHIKKQRHYFANKGPSSQGYGFSSGHV